MPGIPQGPPLVFGHLISLWNVIVIALALLAVLAGVLWIRRSRNLARGGGHRTDGRGPRPLLRPGTQGRSSHAGAKRPAHNAVAVIHTNATAARCSK